MHFKKRFSIIFYSITFFLLFAIFAILDIAVISGYSMLPIFADGDFVLVFRKGTGFRNEDIVLFKMKENYVIKRIKYSNSEVVARNLMRIEDSLMIAVVPYKGMYRDSNYFKHIIAYNANSFSTLPTFNYSKSDAHYLENYYFVVGDNINYSHDSRAHGPIPESAIIGKVLFKLW